MSPTATGQAYYSRLFEQHHRELFAYAYKKTGNTFLAEEIVQNTFIRLWRHKGYTEMQDPSRLLFFIAKGLLVDHFRKKERVTLSVDALPENSLQQDPLNARQDAHHFRKLLQTAVSKLPSRQRQIFELNYFHEQSHDEIAQSLNISSKTVKNLLSKATIQVRNSLTVQFLLLLAALR